jgi:hypothetical protein
MIVCSIAEVCSTAHVQSFVCNETPAVALSGRPLGFGIGSAGAFICSIVMLPSIPLTYTLWLSSTARIRRKSFLAIRIIALGAFIRLQSCL